MTKRNRRMNLLYLPALGLVLLFVLLPLVTSVKTSFYNWNGYSPVKKFVGMKNYLDLFKDENFKMAFLNTILYGFGSTILQNVLGLALALFLNTKFAGHKVVRTIVYLPVMISGLIMGYIITLPALRPSERRSPVWVVNSARGAAPLSVRPMWIS